MKSNIFILCLVDELGINLAREVASMVGFNFYNLSEAVVLPKINCALDLNKLAKNYNLNKISSEQLNIISELNNAVFYSNNFNLLSVEFLPRIKQTCAVVYVRVDKNTYLEHAWQQNINSPSKFKVDSKVFETRDKAYISCAEVLLNYNNNLTKAASTLIKKLEKL